MDIWNSAMGKQESADKESNLLEVLRGPVEASDLEFTVAPICETSDLLQQHSIC